MRLLANAVGVLAVGLGVGLAVVACSDGPDPFADLITVSGESPFLEGCEGTVPMEGANRGAEVEPSLAVDPANPAHLVGAWQQDRWSSGGAAGLVAAVSRDGGLSWTTSAAPFSHCTGGNLSNGGDYERATDPWVTITPDGVVYQIGIGFDVAAARNAILVSRSTDGGATWEDPVPLIAERDLDSFNDKPSITADPTRPGVVYAVWDRLTGLTTPMEPVGTGPALFARGAAGAWEPSRPIFDPGIDAQTIGNVIVVLPDGTLVDAFDRITEMSSPAPTRHLGVIRSTDGGDTWSTPIDVAVVQAAEITDGDDVPVRSAVELVSIAADPASATLYLAWEDARLSGGAVPAIVLAVSVDGGLTWSEPAQVSEDTGRPAFMPTVAAGAGGALAVSYYDLRDDDPDDPGLTVTAWLAVSPDAGATWVEEALTGPFDLRPALLGTAYFLGDYQGLAATDDAFLPFFTAARSGGNPSDVFCAPR